MIKWIDSFLILVIRGVHKLDLFFSALNNFNQQFQSKTVDDFAAYEKRAAIKMIPET